jgi:hypothetical protein
VNLEQQKIAPARELKTAALLEQKLPGLKWLMAFAAGPGLLPVVRNWNSKLCYQAVWLRSDSRTCTLSFLVCLWTVARKTTSFISK